MRKHQRRMQNKKNETEHKTKQNILKGYKKIP